MATNTLSKIIRLPEVCAALGISKPTVYRLIRAENFPRPIQLGKRSVAWRVAEVEQWLESRPAAGGDHG